MYILCPDIFIVCQGPLGLLCRRKLAPGPGPHPQHEPRNGGPPTIPFRRRWLLLPLHSAGPKDWIPKHQNTFLFSHQNWDLTTKNKDSTIKNRYPIIKKRDLT